MRSLYKGAGEGQHCQQGKDDEVHNRGGDDGGVQLRGAFVIHTYGDDVWTRLATALSGDDGGVQLWRAYMWHGDMAGWYTVDINAFEVCVEPNE